MATMIQNCLLNVRRGYIIRVPTLRFQKTLATQTEMKTQHQKVNKVVNVAIIGAPNSGKSTLINSIVGRKICAASNKVHTTVNMVRALCVTDDVQIIFLDTPGVVTPKEQRKYDLPESMTKSCDKSLRVADIIGVVHDVSNKWTKDSLHPHVIRMLDEADDIPSFLVLNKVDLLKTKRQLLTIIKSVTNGFIAGSPVPGTNKRKSKESNERGFSKFSDVFMVSALNGDGVEDIKTYLKQNSKPANLHYPETTFTDQDPERLVEEAVRAKFLDFLAQEIPYKLKSKLEYYEEEEDRIICSVVVYCPSERIARLIQGAGGGRLNQIKSHVCNDLYDLFKKVVMLDLYLRVEHKDANE